MFWCCNSNKDHNGGSGERPLINSTEVVRVRLVTHSMNKMTNFYHIWIVGWFDIRILEQLITSEVLGIDCSLTPLMLWRSDQLVVVGRAPWVFSVWSMTKDLNDRAQILIAQKYENIKVRPKMNKKETRVKNEWSNGREEYWTKYAGAWSIWWWAGWSLGLRGWGKTFKQKKKTKQTCILQNKRHHTHSETIIFR